MANTIARGEAWEYNWRIERRDRYTGDIGPIEEDSVVNAWLSATYKGDPLTPESQLALEQRALEPRVDGRVLWFAILEAQLVTDALTSVATGDPVYEVCEIDGERKSRELTVAD